MNEHEDSTIGQLAADYLTALRLYDDDGKEKHLQTARSLGTTAVEMGLGTLELAKIHDEALTGLLSALASAEKSDAATARAAVFFGEALMSIEKTHQNALDSALELQRINTTLEQRTEELAVSQRQVKLEIEERKSNEDALRTREETAAELLEESRRLEEALREMTHKRLSANEEEREQLRLHLQDRIAQTLLGIHVKLLALKRAISISNEDLGAQIDATQRLLSQSVRIISRFANSLGNDHEN